MSADSCGGVRLINLAHVVPVVLGEEDCNLTPTEAVARRLTFSSELRVDVEFRGVVMAKRVLLGHLPLMVGCDPAWSCMTDPKSGYDAFGTRGYFIIRGNEIVVATQERPATNRIIVLAVPASRLSKVHHSHVVEISSRSMCGARPSRLCLKLVKRTGGILADVPGLLQPIPLGILVSALSPAAWRACVRADADAFADAAASHRSVFVDDPVGCG